MIDTGLNLFNSLSGKKEGFTPFTDEVTVYCCGITPYDTTHLGHAFTYTSVDVLLRYLRFSGYSIRYTQNVTDIDDDIIRKSREVGKDWQQLGNDWTRHFISDLKQLNVLPPDAYPRATDVIPEIIESVQQLLSAGVAYHVDGNVYFEVESWPNFGKLSRIMRDDMLEIANERGNISEDPKKRDPLDFVLWQAQGEGEPAWESPWGMGRPGWHIECSTMSDKFLGKTVDIHAGGRDLIFPHHECEIAQVEPIRPAKPFVRFWMHIAMVYHDGEKMSKSLGNLIMIRNLLTKWTPDAIRLYLAGHHYRSEWSHNERDLAAASERASRYKAAVSIPSGTERALDLGEEVAKFRLAMDQDLDSPAALESLDRMAEDLIEGGKRGLQLGKAQEEFSTLVGIFGVNLISSQPSAEVIKGWDTHLERFSS